MLIHDLHLPRQGRPVYAAGEPLSSAKAAMVMIHGRGGTAESILSLIDSIDVAGFAYLAPEASGNTWYPNSFLAPIPSNEPGITSGLQVIGEILTSLKSEGIPDERITLLGFSQGACLSLEYAARHARRFGGIAGLSGGLIGPDDTPRDYPGAFDGTPVFLGCSDIDFHIPAVRVQQTADVFARMKADVTMRLYPGMGHLVNEDEIDAVRAMMAKVIGAIH
ncbi:MAG: alpha/beta fold hydrolase [Gemmatimonadaceae bacterium]